MSKYRKVVESFISEYATGSGERLWKAHVPNGSGGTFRKQGFLDKALALEWATKMFEQRQFTRGLTTNNFGNLSLEEYSRVWIMDKRNQGVRDQTIIRYEDELRLRIVPHIGRLKMKDITKSHFFGFLRSLQASSIGSTTANFSGQLLKGIIKQAELEDAIRYTGIQNIPLPKKAKPTPIFWTHSEIEHFLSATTNHPEQNLWKFALFTGMRAGEIAALKWDCIHLTRMSGGHMGFIEVRRSIEQKTQRLVETTKNGDRRTIPILPEVREILESREMSGEFVFGGLKPRDTSHFARDLQREARGKGLRKITFHGLRHSFCSWAEAQGINRSITSKIMGHRSQQTTDRYSHANEEVLGRAVGEWMTNKQKTNNLRIVGSSN